MKLAPSHGPATKALAQILDIDPAEVCRLRKRGLPVDRPRELVAALAAQTHGRVHRLVKRANEPFFQRAETLISTIQPRN